MKGEAFGNGTFLPWLPVSEIVRFNNTLTISYNASGLLG